VDLESLFAHYGYLALIFGSFADGTPIMLFGGFAAHRGWLVLIPFVVLAGAVGNFAAAAAWFFAVRTIGEKILTRRPEWARQVAKVRAQLDRWEVPVILGVRFLPGLATAGLIAVALSGISAARFLLLNAVAAVIWAVTFGLLGYLLGNSVEWLLGEVERYEKPIALALLAITLVWIVYHQWRHWGRRGPAGPAPTLGSPT
jgi:membrane protein DedA with SNARE-associated domain